jgi:hypothetical protein
MLLLLCSLALSWPCRPWLLRRCRSQAWRQLPVAGAALRLERCFYFYCERALTQCLFV